ncbi:MAG: cyclic nucleotide-binding domain-containing protein [Methylococcales bacterium]|nr:cyclic nucleotide-binding domain-containing protein [Methylococcales bacterium]
MPNSAKLLTVGDDNPETCETMLNDTIWANEFTYKQIQVLAQYFQAFYIEKNGIIFKEGDPSGELSILTTGKIQIQKNDKALIVLVKGRSFGEMSLFDTQPRSADAIALKYCEYLSIDCESFNRLCNEHPVLSLQFVVIITRIISQRLRKTSGQLSDYLDQSD